MLNKIKDKNRRKQIIGIGLGVLIIILVIITTLYIMNHLGIFKNKVAQVVDNTVNEVANNHEKANPKVIEKKVKPEEVKTHNVAAHQPRYFSMPSLNINRARVLGVGKNSNGEIGTPSGIYDVGWYNKTGTQGQNYNVIFLDGHNGGPTADGIFKKLPSVGTGANFSLERGDGLVSNYKIIENYQVYLDKFTSEDMDNIMQPINKKETVVIVTCTGRWIPSRQTYDKRTIVRATLTSSAKK